MRVYRILRERKSITKVNEPRETDDDRRLLTIITDDSIGTNIITAAWSYALRYSAKGLDLPDYEAAVKLMLSRHPSWRVEDVAVRDIHYNAGSADKDQPET